MGADVNTITLVGRLTRDPELRGSTGSVLSIRLAYSTSRKTDDGWEDVPNYVDVVAFARTAEALSKILERGDQIAVSGRLVWREYETKSGEKRQTYEIASDRIQLLAKPRGKDSPTPSPAVEKPKTAERDETLPPALDDADIPF
jgi:single-strand DNA-binding protein